MKSLLLFFSLLPLGLATRPPPCECPLVKCVSTEPEQCQCENQAAILCYKKCGGKKPKLKTCPTLCGSRGLPDCPKGQECFPNPTKPGCDPKADCPGLCLKPGPFCGGIAAIPCPSPDQTCVDNPNDDCDPKNGGADCGGVCVFLDGTPAKPPVVYGRRPTFTSTFTSCGGFTGKKCPKASQTCVDDPHDSCDPANGGADCPGICIGAACGGFLGTPCEGGDTCVDDPRDDCDPENGGADCSGVCI